MRLAWLLEWPQYVARLSAGSELSEMLILALTDRSYVS